MFVRACKLVRKIYTRENGNCSQLEWLSKLIVSTSLAPNYSLTLSNLLLAIAFHTMWPIQLTLISPLLIQTGTMPTQLVACSLFIYALFLTLFLVFLLPAVHFLSVLFDPSFSIHIKIFLWSIWAFASFYSLSSKNCRNFCGFTFLTCNSEFPLYLSSPELSLELWTCIRSCLLDIS